MRVGIVSTLSTPVRADGAGSVESIVFRLAQGLVERGHEVTVFATADSSPPGRLDAVVPGPYATKGAPADWHACELLNVGRALEASRELDVLHSHSYLNAVPFERLAGCPVLHTTHVLPHDAEVELLRLCPDAAVSAVSRSQWAAYPDVPLAGVVPHGLEAAAHPFRAAPGDHLLYLGRFTPEKGALEAIAAARALGVPLVLAGPRSAFFDEAVAPYVDGRAVRWAGPVGVEARNALLGGARALLYPLHQPEPFGLVMIEAMLCGTPVAAFAIGAVCELVDEGVTGVLVPPGGDLAAAARACASLDRAAVRRRAEERFSAERMVDGYLDLLRAVAAPRRAVA